MSIYYYLCNRCKERFLGPFIMKSCHIILLILLLYYSVKTMAEIDLHFNFSSSDKYKVRFFWHISS